MTNDNCTVKNGMSAMICENYPSNFLNSSAVRMLFWTRVRHKMPEKFATAKLGPLKLFWTGRPGRLLGKGDAQKCPSDPIRQISRSQSGSGETPNTHGKLPG